MFNYWVGRNNLVKQNKSYSIHLLWFCHLSRSYVVVLITLQCSNYESVSTAIFSYWDTIPREDWITSLWQSLNTQQMSMSTNTPWICVHKKRRECAHVSGIYPSTPQFVLAPFRLVMKCSNRSIPDDWRHLGSRSMSNYWNCRMQRYSLYNNTCGFLQNMPLYGISKFRFTWSLIFPAESLAGERAYSLSHRHKPGSKNYRV